MNAIAEITQEAKAATEDVPKIMRFVRTFAVTNGDQYIKAGEVLTRLKGKMAAITEERLKITRPMDAAKKAVMDFFADPLEQLAAGERQIKQAMIAYNQEQDRIRRKAEEEAAEQARIKREADLREAARLEDEARKEREKAEAKAAKLEAAGNVEQAESVRMAAEDREQAKIGDAQQLQAAAVAAPTRPVVLTSTPTVKGISTRKIWTYEVIDEALIPRAFLVLNEKMLDAACKAMKAHTNIPGIRAVERDSMSARSK